MGARHVTSLRELLRTLATRIGRLATAMIVIGLISMMSVVVYVRCLVGALGRRLSLLAPVPGPGVVGDPRSSLHWPK
jgi:hypothetical protein